MKKLKSKKICIIVILILVIIALPASVYAYKYNQYKNAYSEAMSQLDKEKYDESINAFNDISNTYFGKKNSEEIKKDIEKAKKFKENKKVFDDSLKLFNEKKYLEAIESFKKIPKDDTKRYDMAKKKIDECKSLYISLNIENAKNEAKSSKYDSAISYLALVLKLDSANKDAVALKDEYTKAKEAAELKVKQEAEKKAKQEAEEKAKKEAANKIANPPISIVPRLPTNPQTSTYVPTQVSGTAAIKKEFEKMGFVFQSGNKASYNKNGVYAELENLESEANCWAVSTSSLGPLEERLFFNAIAIIWGTDRASYNLTYIRYAADSSDSYGTPNIKAVVNNQKLYVFIYLTERQ